MHTACIVLIVVVRVAGITNGVMAWSGDGIW